MKKNRKELIQLMFKKYNKTECSFVEKVNPGTMGFMGSCGNVVKFDLVDGKLLVEADIGEINESIQCLVLFRGTKEEIISKLNEIGLRDDCFLEEFENPLPENDFGFNTNLGVIGNKYLDFEVYLLPTNKKDVFLVTEVNEF